MKHRFGDLFTTDAGVIGHGVNCAGVMGAGIAKTFKERFPNNYVQYRLNCHSTAGRLRAGSALGYEENDFYILNFASQDRPGPDARYPWLYSSLYNGAHMLLQQRALCDKYGTTIAIPEIGCGIGGLEWRKARTVMQSVEDCLDREVEFEVWHYG